MIKETKDVKYSLSKKLFAGLAVIVFIVGTILAYTSYFYNKQYIFEITSKLATSCAIDTANMLKGAPLDKFLAGEEQDLYNSHLKSLKNISNTFGLQYLYVYIPDTQNNRLIAIMGVEGETGNTIKDFELGNYPKNLKLNNDVMKMFNSKSQTLSIQVDNEYGHVLSGYATIFDNNSEPMAIVGADIDFSVIMDNLKKNTIETFLSIFLTLLLISALVIFYINKTFIKPILQLAKGMQSATNENDSQYLPIEIQTNDEFTQIANLYNSVSKEKQRMKGELLVARTIQLSSLPSKFPPFPEHKEFDIFANTLPAKEVGGDFYDFFFINENKLMFLIADVSGKGIPAALFMMTAKTLIKSIASEISSPKEMMNKINKQLYENNEQGFFITLFAVIVDITTGQASFINCGHTPPLIRKNNNKYEFMNIPSNLVLGVVGDFDYEVWETVLSKDDILFFYTDGITEAFNEQEELYGEQRLLSSINSDINISENNLNKIVENISIDVKKHVQNAEQSDDITMVVFKFNKD